jgi:uncharacterized membrane protein
MSVFWWFIGVVLITLSLVLLVAVMTRREGVLRIGKRTVAETRNETETRLRSVKLSNVVVGTIGVLVGLAIILIMAV